MWYNAFGDRPLPPPLSPDAEREMVNRVRQGDEKAREALIEHNLRFVVSIARKYQSDRAELEDLVSIGVCGLIKAVDSFNPDKGYRLITYIGRCVVNEILMELRKLKRRGYPDSLDAILYEDEDGGGLRLEDLLGTEPDTVSQERLKWRRIWRCCAGAWTRCRRCNVKSSPCTTAKRTRPRAP